MGCFGVFLVFALLATAAGLNTGARMPAASGLGARSSWTGGLQRRGPQIPGKPPRVPTLWMSMNGETPDDESVGDEVREEEGSNPLGKQWSKLSKETKEDIVTTLGSFAFALVIRILLVEPRFIPSLSMFPTFDIGDQLLVDKVSHFARGYQRRDVVVFNPPLTYVELTGNTEALIKRVVAVGGDTVEVKNRHVYVNGEQQVERYINEDPDYELKPLTVPQGMLLVLGDNRNHSYDSHIWGFLPKENVIGRAVFKYWPPWRVGSVEGSE